MKIIRPTYIGFHGYLGEWLNDNPELTVTLLNKCGYWYFPKSIHSKEYKNGLLSFDVEWMNKGVAPAYNPYQLKGKLIPVDNTSEPIEFEIKDSGNKSWMPGQFSTEKYTASLSGNPKGDYLLAIQLYDEKSETPVEIGLSTILKADDYFNVQEISF
jgi:hypothetical protein